MESFEIFFDDLNDEAKANFLEFFNMKKEDGNFELAPIAIVDMEVEIPIKKDKKAKHRPTLQEFKLSLDDAL